MQYDISGSVTLPDISIRRYKLVYVGPWIELVEDQRDVDPKAALELLLNSPGVRLGPETELEPCFDLEEMERRNMVAKHRHDVGKSRTAEVSREPSLMCPEWVGDYPVGYRTVR